MQGGLNDRTCDYTLLAADSPTYVSGGSTWLSRVRVDEKGVCVLPEAQPPANPKNRTLYLRSNDEIKVQLIVVLFNRKGNR